MIISPEAAADKMRQQADRAFRALILECARRIIFRTPVDTGRARGNWQISIGSPRPTPDERTDKDGGSTVFNIVGDTKSVDSGEVVFLLNGLPYIVYLERGTSDQSPSGMVAITVAELQDFAREVAAEIRRVQ